MTDNTNDTTSNTPINAVKECARPGCTGFIVVPITRPSKFNSRKYCSVACSHACKGKTRIARLKAEGWDASSKTRNNRRWYKKNPEKEKAQRMTRAARAKGWLPTYDDCAVCETTGPVEYHHHWGYTGMNARKVVGLCSSCHADAHHEVRVDDRVEHVAPGPLAVEIRKAWDQAVEARLEAAARTF